MNEQFRAMFDRGVDRRGTSSYKWDSDKAENILPLWVADMDFCTAPGVQRALEERARHGVYGYVKVPQSYYDSVVDWFDRRHGWRIDAAHMLYTSGVVPALSAVIKALTRPCDNVLVQTPVYNCFFSSIRNNGCNVLANPLIYTGQSYQIDFADLEAKAADDRTTLMLLCNPANPAGRVWTRDELLEIARICRRHNVVVVSDEVHCELVYAPHVYTPYGTLPREYVERSVVCVSPGKAFNIAGLQIANIIAPDSDMRAAIDRALNINEVCDVGTFGVVAAQAAYETGAPWLDSLVEYIAENNEYMQAYCARHLPQFPLCRLEGTYLVWMNTRSTGMLSDDLERELRNATGLWLNSGAMYGDDGEGFMRWNIACPRATLIDALNRFTNFINALPQ